MRIDTINIKLLNMKNKTLLLIFSIITHLAFGQDKLFDILPIQDGIVTYSGVVQPDEYLSAFVLNFNNIF